ncbi:MAG: DNA internalization-related competence protein ComEC/Rec2 [Armatimonadetes bacterium]|nr:DNA internalization-related competence protein ComEC/Rec2 [Armatimonadota bacterium]
MTKHPLVPVALTYVAALLVAPRVTVPSVALWVVAAAAALVALALASTRRAPWGTAICVLLSTSALGVLRHKMANEVPTDDISRVSGSSPVACAGVVADPITYRTATAETVVEATHHPREDSQESLSGRVLLVANWRVRARVGDAVWFRAPLKPLAEATNPGQFSEAADRLGDGVRVTAFVPPGALHVGGAQPRRRLERLAESVRQWVSATLLAHTPNPYRDLHAQLMCSILYGMHAAPLPPGIVDAFRRSGTIHLLVVSGTQVAFLVGLLLALSGGLSRWLRLTLIGCALPFYVLLTAHPPSIIRASVVGAMGVAAVLLGKDVDGLNALAFAALVILGTCPADLNSIGLQLSFGACFGILVLTPLFMRFLAFLPRWFALSVAVTCAAQAGVAPLLAYHFGAISLVAPVANLIAIPTAAALLIVGMLTSAAAPLLPAVADRSGALGHCLTSVLVQNATFFSNWPLAVARVAGTGMLWLLAGYGVLTVSLVLDTPPVRRWLSRERVLALTAVVATLTVGWFTYSKLRPRELAVTFLDVGQGDSIVVRSPTGKTVLIDGGSHDRTFRDVGERVIVPYLAELGVRKLDAILVTHPHEDHVNGLVTVLQQVGADMILDPQQPAAACAAYESFREEAEQQGAHVEPISRGDSLDLGGGAKLWVLWPPDRPVQGTSDDENNNSAVVEVALGKTSFLLTGDLRAEGERLLLNYGDDLRSTVLKGGHHGGPGTTSDEFLDRVSPKACALSVGRNNPFGHPAAETVARLRRRGVRLYQTALDGAVLCRTDGRRLEVSSFRSRHRPNVLPVGAKARPTDRGNRSDGSDRSGRPD